MVAGQGALSGPLDVGAMTAVETGFEARLAARGAAHVADLQGALEVRRLYADAGMALSAVPHLALVLRCSEMKAGELLGDAQILVALPGAFEAISSDVLRVDDVHVVCAPARAAARRGAPGGVGTAAANPSVRRRAWGRVSASQVARPTPRRPTARRLVHHRPHAVIP